MRGIFAVFLFVCAWRDLKEKEIPVWILAAAATGGILWTAGRLVCYDWVDDKEKIGWFFMQTVSVLPGVLLFIISKLSRGAVGEGDGLFFAVSGLYIGFWNNVALLFYGLLFCSAWGLGIFIWGILEGKKIWNIKLPFLPFLVPAAFILVLFQNIGRL